MLDSNEVKKVESVEEEGGAPAVVGTLKVSNDLLDFSSLGKPKKAEVKVEEKVDESNLTPRQKAILERKKKEQCSCKSVELIEVTPLEAKEVKLAPIRRAIAKNLKNAMDHVAYTSLVQKADATALWNHRAAVKDKVFNEQGVKLTFLSWIIKAVTIALSEFPIFAAKVNEETNMIHYPGQLNISIAVDTPHGLFVPVIKNADKLSIVEIQKEIVRLAGLARAKKLTPADMQGADFTITNVGSVGVLFGNPIMNYPEISILATGAIFDELVRVNGEIVDKKSMYLSVAADHRWVDGGDIGRFNSRIKELIENPEKLGVL